MLSAIFESRPLGTAVSFPNHLMDPDSSVPPQGVLPHNWAGTEQNSAVRCMVFKATDNDRRKNLASCRDEYRGP
ncbi:hypothetical protein TNCV_4700181 [Trichonephila clavipes]|nr:hypothetical protein TNCV_4700181 [Trichonephila clavipes]